MIHEAIQAVADAIVQQCSPLKIYLVSEKRDITQSLVSFKLALIVPADAGNISELECMLYANIDSDYPYDLVLYKITEWETLRSDNRTFAWKIEQTGSVLYE